MTLVRGHGVCGDPDQQDPTAVPDVGVEVLGRRHVQVPVVERPERVGDRSRSGRTASAGGRAEWEGHRRAARRCRRTCRSARTRPGRGRRSTPPDSRSRCSTPGGDDDVVVGGAPVTEPDVYSARIPRHLGHSTATTSTPPAVNRCLLRALLTALDCTPTAARVGGGRAGERHVAHSTSEHPGRCGRPGGDGPECGVLLAGPGDEGVGAARGGLVRSPTARSRRTCSSPPRRRRPTSRRPTESSTSPRAANCRVRSPDAAGGSAFARSTAAVSPGSGARGAP